MMKEQGLMKMEQELSEELMKKEADKNKELQKGQSSLKRTASEQPVQFCVWLQWMG